MAESSHTLPSNAKNTNDFDHYNEYQSISDEINGHPSRTSTETNESVFDVRDNINIVSTSESSSLTSSFINEESSNSGVVPFSDNIIMGSSLVYDHQSTASTEDRTALPFFKQIIENCPSLMKIHGCAQFMDAVTDLCKKDEDIKNWWEHTNEQVGNNYKSMQAKVSECFNVLMNNGRDIMIGLDSIPSLKDILIVCMRMATESDFQLEIRIVLGGSKYPLNVRIPAYAVAGIDLLQRLMKLREKYALAAHPSLSGITPPSTTQILKHAPRLTFFSSYSAAVQVNNLNQYEGNRNVCNMFSYIKKYVNKFHSDLIEHVRYEFDHSTTYEPQLLDQFVELVSNCQDKTIIKVLQSLAKHAKNHGSNENGHIRYSSMHSFMFKDIIDTHCSNGLIHLLNNDDKEEEVEFDMSIPDCMISIGGSVEKQFNEVRQCIKDAFRHDQDINSKERFRYPLSVRMLSKVGQTPVYYPHATHEILVADVQNGTITRLNREDRAAKPINDDLKILKQDIGMSILKPIFGSILELTSADITPWTGIETILINLCLIAWRSYAKNTSRSNPSPTQNVAAVDEMLQYWNISNVLTNDGRSIFECILRYLEEHFRCPFGNPGARDNKGNICINNRTIDEIRARLDQRLDQILIDFVCTIFPNENHQ